MKKINNRFDFFNHIQRAGRGAAVILLTAFMLSGCRGAGNTEAVKNAEKLLEERDYASARTAFEEAAGRTDDSKEAYRGLGIACMGQGDYEAARAAFEKALSSGGSLVSDIEYDINFYLAVCYYKTGETEKAIEVYNAILGLRPRDVEAYELRGTARATSGDREGALEDFSKAISLAPRDYDRLVSIYRVMQENGMTEEGKEFLNKAMEAGGNNLGNLNKGRLAYYLEDYQTAKTCLEQARATDPADYRTAEMLGMTYEKLGDYNYAVSVYQSYLEKDTSHAEIYNQLGLCQIQMENYADALNAFEQGKAVNDNAVMQKLSYNEIVAYEHLGEWKKATVMMEAYLQAYPSDENAQREYQFLKTR